MPKYSNKPYYNRRRVRGGNSWQQKMWSLGRVAAPYAVNYGASYIKKKISTPRRRLPGRQFGGRFLPRYRRKGSRFQKKRRTLARYVGHGSQTYKTFIAQDTSKITVSIDKTQFNLNTVANGANGINTKDTKDTVIPLIQTAFASSTDNDARVIIKNQTSTISFKNQSNVQAKVQLLVVKCIRDVPDEEVTLQTMLGKGFLDYGLDDSGEHSPGVTIYQCPRFWRYFKIANTKTFFLDPGAQREKTITSQYPQVWTEKYTNTSSYLELKGALRFMFIIQGSIVHDATTDTNIGFSPLTLDVSWVQRIQATVGSVQEPGAVYTATGLTAPTTGAAFVNAEADEENIET